MAPTSSGPAGRTLTPAGRADILREQIDAATEL
jgi:hypothetical protein